jgi:hypothetical protein
LSLSFDKGGAIPDGGDPERAVIVIGRAEYDEPEDVEADIVFCYIIIKVGPARVLLEGNPVRKHANFSAERLGKFFFFYPTA